MIKFERKKDEEDIRQSIKEGAELWKFEIPMLEKNKQDSINEEIQLDFSNGLEIRIYIDRDGDLCISTKLLVYIHPPETSIITTKTQFRRTIQLRSKLWGFQILTIKKNKQNLFRYEEPYCAEEEIRLDFSNGLEMRIYIGNEGDLCVYTR